MMILLALCEGMPGSVLAGLVERASAALVSPDLRWAVVATVPTADQPITLWLVTLHRRQ
jgi:hypothetical protein